MQLWAVLSDAHPHARGDLAVTERIHNPCVDPTRIDVEEVTHPAHRILQVLLGIVLVPLPDSNLLILLC